MVPVQVLLPSVLLLSCSLSLAWSHMGYKRTTHDLEYTKVIRST
jgi:hypothetical protein